MAIKEYREFVLIAREREKDPQGCRQISTQVFSSPAGEGLGEEVRSVPKDLSTKLFRLENRKMDMAEIITLGEVLADVLFPDKVRDLFDRSFDDLEDEQGLRLRLRLSPSLAEIPWEYLYMQLGGGEKDITGFLALKPRLSLVRHEALPVSGELDVTPKSRRLLVTMASPKEPGYAPLELTEETANLQKALEDVPGIELELIEQATIPGLQEKLLHGADIFHFAGHGGFKTTGLGEEIRSIVGQGEIFLVDDNGGPAPCPADQLAVHLHGSGVQLAVLDACHTGRRDVKNVWSGVVAALMEAGIPAVVAMQYKIWDDAAIAFSRSFYQALAAGLTLDQAVWAGRLATFNLVHANREDGELGQYWRDWGVPVLYLRSQETFRLPAITDAKQQQGVLSDLNNLFIEVKKTIDVVEGSDIGAIIKKMTAGRVNIREKIDKIKKGATSIGAVIGASGSAAKSGSQPTPAEAGKAHLICPKCQKPNDPEAKFCSNCGTPMVAGPKFCQQCGEKVTPGAKFCQQCGRSVS
jgi:hypothetical protein